MSGTFSQPQQLPEGQKGLRSHIVMDTRLRSHSGSALDEGVTEGGSVFTLQINRVVFLNTVENNQLLG